MPERTLIELFHGKGAHANPVACVGDLSSALAARTISGFPHSIWQLLAHMNYWMDYEIQRVASQAPPYPEHASASWLSDPTPPSDAAWQNGVARFRDLIDTLIRLARSGPAALSREVPAAHSQQGAQPSSVEAILWQTMAHNTYHTGQIAVLRRSFGAWPPVGGGDTW